MWASDTHESRTDDGRAACCSDSTPMTRSGASAGSAVLRRAAADYLQCRGTRQVSKAYVRACGHGDGLDDGFAGRGARKSMARTVNRAASGSSRSTSDNVWSRLRSGSGSEPGTTCSLSPGSCNSWNCPATTTSNGPVPIAHLFVVGNDSRLRASAVPRDSGAAMDLHRPTGERIVGRLAAPHVRLARAEMRQACWE